MKRVDRLLRTNTIHGVRKWCTDQTPIVCTKHLQAATAVESGGRKTPVGPSFSHGQLPQSRSTRFSEWSRRMAANRCDPRTLKDSISHLKQPFVNNAPLGRQYFFWAFENYCSSINIEIAICGWAGWETCPNTISSIQMTEEHTCTYNYFLFHGDYSEDWQIKRKPNGLMTKWKCDSLWLSHTEVECNIYILRMVQFWSVNEPQLLDLR